MISRVGVRYVRAYVLINILCDVSMWVEVVCSLKCVLGAQNLNYHNYPYLQPDRPPHPYKPYAIFTFSSVYTASFIQLTFITYFVFDSH